MPTRNVELTESHDRFVDEQVAAGHFQDADEVVTAGLELLEARRRVEQEQLASLRKLATEGFDELDQGRGIVIDGDERLAEFIRKSGRAASLPESPDESA
ncbi:MAG: type II toxin-antitoxin system ParD family antitoxin [Planctomycetaceae bacterium]